MDKINLAPGPARGVAHQINQHLKALYALLGAGRGDRFLWAASGARALREILLSHYLHFIRETGRTHLLTLPVLSPSAEHAVGELEQMGVVRKPLPLNRNGQLTREALEEVLRARSSLLTLPWADPLTGVIQPIHELAEVCREQGVRVHVEGTAALGKLFFRFRDLSIDFFSFDALSCKGGGALVKEGVVFCSAEEPDEGALAHLVEELDASMPLFDHFSTETARLRDLLEQGIEERVEGALPLLREVERLPNVALLTIPGVHSDALLYLLERRGVCASNGGGRFPALSATLLSYGYDALTAQTAVSFTLSAHTTEQMVARALEEVATVASRLQRVSKEALCS